MKIFSKICQGFTFVELMVVIGIASIMFAIATVSFTNVSKSSRDARRKADMESIRQALELCRSFSGKYPDSIDGNVSCTYNLVTQTFLKTTPTDPKTPAVLYTYIPVPVGAATSYTLRSSSMESQANPYDVYNP